MGANACAPQDGKVPPTRDHDHGAGPPAKLRPIARLIDRPGRPPRSDEPSIRTVPNPTPRPSNGTRSPHRSLTARACGANPEPAGEGRTYANSARFACGLPGGKAPRRRPPPSMRSASTWKGAPPLPNHPRPTSAVGSPSAATRGGTGGAFALPYPPEPTSAVGSPDALPPARSGPPSLPPGGRRAGRTGLSAARGLPSSDPARAPRAIATTGRRDRGRAIAAVPVFDVLDRGGPVLSPRSRRRHRRHVRHRRFRAGRAPTPRPVRDVTEAADLRTLATIPCLSVTTRLAPSALPPERDPAGRAGPWEGVDPEDGIGPALHPGGASPRRTGG